MTADGKYSMADFVTTCLATGCTPLIELNAALALVNGSTEASTYFLEWHEAFLSAGLNVTYYEFGSKHQHSKLLSCSISLIMS